MQQTPEIQLSAESSPIEASGFQLIPVDQLFPGEYQPRVHFDEDELSRLGQTFLTSDVGVIHPLVVRKTPRGYEIVAGERRWRAAKKVKLERLPCIVRKLTDMQCLTIGLIENAEQRKLTCLEKARAYRRAREDFDITQDALAQMLAISRVVIANHERLLQLDPKIQAYLVDGRLTEKHGRQLIGFPVEQALELAKRVVSENLSATALEALVKQLKRAAKEKKPVEPLNPDEKNLIERLCLHSGYQIELEKLAGKKTEGYLKVRYHTLDEFEAISLRLLGRGK